MNNLAVKGLKWENRIDQAGFYELCNMPCIYIRRWDMAKPHMISNKYIEVGSI